MKAIIVDDTRLARQELQFLLKEQKSVEVTSACPDKKGR